MSNISPKLIDVENNRVEAGYIGSRLNKTYKPCITFGPNANNKVDDYIPNKNGRFPTQLFTNIKNDRFKYVKRINI
jgi:hypothetical protein